MIKHTHRIWAACSLHISTCSFTSIGHILRISDHLHLSTGDKVSAKLRSWRIGNWMSSFSVSVRLLMDEKERKKKNAENRRKKLTSKPEPGTKASVSIDLDVEPMRNQNPPGDELHRFAYFPPPFFFFHSSITRAGHYRRGPSIRTNSVFNQPEENACSIIGSGLTSPMERRLPQRIRVTSGRRTSLSSREDLKTYRRA
jgi:hypothetical protein